MSLVTNQVGEDVCTHGAANGESLSVLFLAVSIKNMGHGLQHIFPGAAVIKLWCRQFCATESTIIYYDDVEISRHGKSDHILDIAGLAIAGQPWAHK